MPDRYRFNPATPHARGLHRALVEARGLVPDPMCGQGVGNPGPITDDLTFVIHLDEG